MLFVYMRHYKSYTLLKRKRSKQHCSYTLYFLCGNVLMYCKYLIVDFIYHKNYYLH